MICLRCFEVTDDAGAPTGIWRRFVYSDRYLPGVLLLELCQHDHRTRAEAHQCAEASERARTIWTEDDLVRAIKAKRRA